MAQIQYTPYVNQTQISTFQPPSFEVDVPSIRSKPKEPIVLNPLPVTKNIPEQAVQITPVTTIVKGITDNSGKYNLGNMQHVIDAFENAGISVRVTSGSRPGAMTAQGKQSHHSLGNAIDITPNFSQGETWDSLRNKVRASKELQNYLTSHNIGILDETTPEALARTKGTGAHWHIGPDIVAIEGLRRLIAKHGMKFQPGGSVEYTPYTQKHLYAWFNEQTNDRQPIEGRGVTLIKSKPKEYQKQYNLSDPPRVDNGFDKWYQYVSTTLGLDPNPDDPEHHYDYRGYYDDLVKQGKQYEVIPEGFHFPDTYKLPGHPTFSVESKYYKPGMDAGHWEGDKFIGPKTIADLAKFTGSFETFNPEAYMLNTSDGKPQTLAGYGSANPEIIKLAKEGKLTEEIARKEMQRHLQQEYDDWMKLVPNFKNLSRGVQLALVDTSYNGKGVASTIQNSPKLMKMINSGITDPKELVKQMDHSKTAGGWLGVRSAARRAMALDEYDWDWKNVDRFGRQVDYTKYRGPEDWKASPYYNKY